MSKEIILNSEPNRQIEQLKHLESLLLNAPLLFENNISSGLLSQIDNSLSNDRLVLFVGNHQSYFESEVWAQIAQDLSKSCPNFKGIYLPYSAPATDSNVGAIFNQREQHYRDNKLFMLPVIREIDRTSEKYSKAITPKMEKDNAESMYKMVHARKEHYAIICLPEGSLKAGRTNPETGKIFGMQPVVDKTFLDLIFKKGKANKMISQTDLVPIGIDGCYKIFSSDTYTFSDNLTFLFKYNQTDTYTSSNQQIYLLKNSQKIVSINANKIIPAVEYLSYDGNVIEHIMRKEVAPLVSTEAQGVYNSQNRVNLDKI